MEILAEFLKEAFQNYVKRNQGQRPDQIIVYRDGVGGPTYLDKCLRVEGPGGKLMSAIKQFDVNYDPKMLYIFVD